MTADTPTRLAILGLGRMGREVDALAAERGFEVVARLDVEDVADHDSAMAALGGADVAIDFTVPAAAVGNIELCLAAGVPVVVGTTGWLDRLDEVTGKVDEADGSLLWAPNFSVGVAIMRELARRAGEILSGVDGFEVQLVDVHHAKKLDAPSGTALHLQRALEESGIEAPISSIRFGHVPGRHELCIGGTYEQVTVSHEARDRRVFADGALSAARWLLGRKGVFTMDDVLGLEGS